MTLTWVFDSPRETLRADSLSQLSVTEAVACLLSAFFSYAVAETYMAEVRGPAGPSSGSLGSGLALNFFPPLLALVLCLGLFYQLTRFLSGNRVGVGGWFRAGVVAAMPLHLALPFALLLKPLGLTGLVLYSLCDVGILLCTFRRWTWATAALTGLPVWASSLVVLSPLLLASMVLVLFSAIAFLTLLLVLLGIIG